MGAVGWQKVILELESRTQDLNPSGLLFTACRYMTGVRVACQSTMAVRIHVSIPGVRLHAGWG
jgi:hypothetical protein